MFLRWEFAPLSEPEQKEEAVKDSEELFTMVREAKKQIEEGKIDKNFLIKLNTKAEELQVNYGNIAAIAVAVAALISGLKDCGKREGGVTHQKIINSVKL